MIYLAVTYGFYNSINGDRRYDATQLSSLFDGIIQDGVFASIGTCFAVKAKTGNTVDVGIGRAWFEHTWTYNDSILPITLEAADVLLGRIDAVVIEIDTSESVRANSIKYVKGTPSSNPTRPMLIKTNYKKQFPICYILRPANSTSISQAHITNMVGTNETPFVIGAVKSITHDQLVSQWQDMLRIFVENRTNDFNNWFDTMKSNMTREHRELAEWLLREKTEFGSWFNNIKGQLSTDAAGNLQLSIEKIDIEQILIIGLSNCRKTISSDGRTITSVEPNGRTLTTVFSNDFLTITKVLKDNNQRELGRMVRVIDPNGSVVNSTVTLSHTHYVI